jgi:hypothetical protein
MLGDLCGVFEFWRYRIPYAGSEFGCEFFDFVAGCGAIGELLLEVPDCIGKAGGEFREA